MKSDERLEITLNTQRLINDVRAVLGEDGLRGLSAKIGISASTLSRIDNGETPDMETFMAICSACHLLPGDYFDQTIWVIKR